MVASFADNIPKGISMNANHVYGIQFLLKCFADCPIFNNLAFDQMACYQTSSKLWPILTKIYDVVWRHQGLFELSWAGQGR